MGATSHNHHFTARRCVFFFTPLLTFRPKRCLGVVRDRFVAMHQPSRGEREEERERWVLKHLVRATRAAVVAPGNPALIYTRPMRRSINPGPIVKRGECDRPAGRNYNYPDYLQQHNSRRRAVKTQRAIVPRSGDDHRSFRRSLRDARSSWLMRARAR